MVMAILLEEENYDSLTVSIFWLSLKTKGRSWIVGHKDYQNMACFYLLLVLGRASPQWQYYLGAPISSPVFQAGGNNQACNCFIHILYSKALHSNVYSIRIKAIYPQLKLWTRWIALYWSNRYNWWVFLIRIIEQWERVTKFQSKSSYR